MNLKSALKFLLKLGLSALAIFLILRKVDLEEALANLSSANLGFILLAFSFFFISKVISAFRINALYHSRDMQVSQLLNGKLTFMAMFYNLFVPLVGGEAYKAYWLKKNYEYSAKVSLTAALLDRLAGMVALTALALIFFYFSAYTWEFKWLSFLAIPILYLAYYFGSKWIFPKFITAWTWTGIYSLMIQCLQVATVFTILHALHIEEQVIEYIFVFLLATFAFVLPLVGAREMAFVFGSEYLGLKMETSLAIALMFYLSVLSSSAIGMFLFLFEKNLRRTED